MKLVAVDIGGTHARFAVAEIIRGRDIRLSHCISLKSADYTGFQAAWQHFARCTGAPLPRAAAIAVACPLGGDRLKLTNSSWIIEPAALPGELGTDRLTLVNDFGAIGHALAWGRRDGGGLQHVTGPDRPLPVQGLISIIGPGTGLGVAQLLLRNGGAFVLETEGGHSAFSPLDDIEDAILARLRARHGRVSVERIVSGPGLVDIYHTLAAIENRSADIQDDKLLWSAALEGRDTLAVSALRRFCMILGSVAGDIALSQGAAGVVIAGGIGQRIAAVLPTSGFAGRFADKGRLAPHMAVIPVKLAADPHIGLIGAAAAFAAEHPD